MATNDNASPPSGEVPQDRAVAVGHAGLPGPHYAQVLAGVPEVLPPASAAMPNAMSVLHAVRRHWLLIVGLGLVGAAVGAPAAWFGRGAQYEATALLRVFPTERIIVYKLESENPAATAAAFEGYKATQSQLIRSRFVLTAALRKQSVAQLPSVQKHSDDPVAWLAKEISVFFPEKGELMQVGLTGPDAEEVTALVRAVVDAYLNEVVDVERNQRRQRLSELDRIYAEKESEMRSKRTDLRKLAEQLGTTDKDTLSLKQQNAVQQFAEYQKELVQMQFRLLHARAQLRAQQATLALVNEMKISDYEVERMGLMNPTVRQLSDQVAALQGAVDYTKKHSAPGAGDRLVKRFEDNLAMLQGQYEEVNRQLREKVRGQKRADAEAEMRRLEAEVSIAEEQEKHFHQEVDQKRKEVEQIGSSSIDIELMRAELKQTDSVLTGIAEERERLRVELRSASRIQLIQSAEKPQAEVGQPLRIAMMAFAAMVGMMLPGIAVVLWDLRRSRINAASEVSKKYGLRVLGSIPLIPARVIRRLGAPGKQHQQWRFRLTEAADAVTARLLRSAQTNRASVILVSSAVGREGKTTLATQLAMSFARNGRRTVLVDFDLRRPALDAVFGLPLGPGVSEVLRGANDSSQVIQQTATNNLAVVPAGYWDRQALAALANGAGRNLIDRLRAGFDLVVIDSSPILPVADTRFVSQQADTVVLSVFRDVSEGPRIEATCEILEAFGVRNIEAVVIGPNEFLYGKDFQYQTELEAPATES